MTNIMPEVLAEGNNRPDRRNQSKSRGRKTSIPSQRGERKAGSIFRRRSESPTMDRETRSEGDDHTHITCEDEV